MIAAADGHRAGNGVHNSSSIDPVGVKKVDDGMATVDPKHKKRAHQHDLSMAHIQDRVGHATHAGVKAKHRRAVTVLGRIGWIAKGLVYALIGGLCCRAATSDDFTASNIDASPQGAFVLIGRGVTGIYILILMAVALATYICWRFWEGVTAQGSHPIYGKFKNFFSFRLSPLVSGAVYTAYLVYILTLIPKAFDYKNNAVENTNGNDFTADWNKTGIGRTGLVILAIAFIAATATQLQGALTKKFHRELRLKELRPWAKWLVLITGHIGFLGRAALFCFVAVLMCRALHGSSGNRKKNTISNALTQLTTSKGGRAVLFLIGFGLIVYCLYAVLNSYPARIFPTPLPSQKEMEEIEEKRREKERLKAEKAAAKGDRAKTKLEKAIAMLPLPGKHSNSATTATIGSQPKLATAV